MKINGLIGGFFWMLQFSMWGIAGFPNVSLPAFSEFIALVNPIPWQVFPALIAILGVLGLILIFTTGVLLDLLSSTFYRASESRIFVKNLKQNKQWLQNLVDENREYTQDDWQILLNASPKLAITVWRGGREAKRSFSKESMALREPYRRFQDFLLAYVLLRSGGEKNELLSTQMSLWNLARAIATVMFIGAFTMAVAAAVAAFATMNTLTVIILLPTQLALAVGSFAVAISAYARVCSTLFANAFVIMSGASSQTARTSPNLPP